MIPLRHALANLALTARDFVARPEVDLAPAPEPEGHDVFADIVHPAESGSTEPTVREWLDSAVAPAPADGCQHCDLPPGQHHGLRDAALVGKHPYTEPTGLQVAQRGRARDRAQGVAR